MSDILPNTIGLVVVNPIYQLCTWYEECHRFKGLACGERKYAIIERKV